MENNKSPEPTVDLLLRKLNSDSTNSPRNESLLGYKRSDSLTKVAKMNFKERMSLMKKMKESGQNLDDLVKVE